MPDPNPVVRVLTILIPIAALVCLALGGLFLWVQFSFSYRKQNTAKTAGSLRETDHRKNVTVHAKRRSYFIKNLTKALYIYSVNGVEYGIREEFFRTKRQTPRVVPVVYHKKFPRFAYLDEIGSFSDFIYGLKGILLLVWGLCLAFITGMIITRL